MVKQICFRPYRRTFHALLDFVARHVNSRLLNDRPRRTSAIQEGVGILVPFQHSLSSLDSFSKLFRLPAKLGVRSNIEQTDNERVLSALSLVFKISSQIFYTVKPQTARKEKVLQNLELLVFKVLYYFLFWKYILEGFIANFKTPLLT